MLKAVTNLVNVSQITGVLPVVNGGTGVTTSTGTGNTVLSAAPTLSGDVALSTGNIVPSTAGKGINFTANTPAAGMTSELLNWYEEGTFTPTITTLTFVGSPTYTGHYVRTGRLVFITLRIQATSIASSGSTISEGFPFLSASILTTCPVTNSSTNASLGNGLFFFSGGNTILYMPTFSAVTDVTLSGFYLV